MNHASIIDGIRLTKADKKVYQHVDMSDLERVLRKSMNYRMRLIVTDGVFSMDGNIAPLPDIVELAEKYDAFVMVDDAHASGVLGENGRGTVNHFGLDGRVHIQVGTLSKAIGVLGGYAAGSKVLIDYLRHKAVHFYSAHLIRRLSLQLVWKRLMSCLKSRSIWSACGRILPILKQCL